jgi:DNA-binding transcriptional MerR regulator/mannose-6-phosphate isomerase-like protein (cupin superfamily)
VYRIADVARLAGVSPSTLRMWEQHGLLAPTRSDSGQRLYRAQDLDRVQAIKRLRDVDGLNLAAIRRALADGDSAAAANASGRQRRRAAAASSSRDATPALGEVYRLARQSARMSLRAAATQTGLPISFISTFERTAKGATVASLRLLAECYGRTVTELAGSTDATTSPGEAAAVVRQGRERQLPAFGEGIRTLQLAEVATLLDCQKWLLRPGSHSHGSYAHEGEEFIHVLTGELLLTLDGATQHRLRAGDSIAFSSQRPHAWAAQGEVETVLLWVNTPRSF